MKIKNIIKFFLLLTFLVGCFSFTAFAEASVATVSSYTGSVSVKKSGGEKKIAAFKGMRLKKGDTIITSKKSSATLDIDGNKEVIIGDNTQLSITELSKEIAKNSSKSSFTLQAGKVWSNVKKKLDKDSKFQIKTSTTIAGVRGTKFYVSQEEGQTEIAVLEGTVFAETYVPAAQPAGDSIIEKIEKVIEKDQHLKVDDTIKNKDDIVQQPLKLETLNSFVLESYKNSITDSNPELVNDLDKIIEEKKIEEEKKDTTNNDDDEKVTPKISYDPVVEPEIPTNTDTTGYNPIPDPVPNSAPTATDLSIRGISETGSTLTGEYTYSDIENDAEGTSLYQWYRGHNIDGLDKTEIEDATSISYTLTALDLDKYIFFEVTPVAATGTLTGQPKLVELETPVHMPNTAPVASSLCITGITGIPEVSQTLTGNYVYLDNEGDPEGTSLFKWYRATSIDGSDKTEIQGATSISYTLTELDLDKYIFFEVTPVATTGILTGQPTHCVISSDTTPLVGTFLNISSPSVSTLFIQFNETLHADTVAITNPSTLILNSTVKVSNTEFTELVIVKDVKWNNTGSMTNSPILAINLDRPIFIYSQVGIQIQFNQNVIKDMYGNISNGIVYGQLINDGSTNVLNLSENTINSDGATLTISLKAEQGNWVQDIVSDTSKLNKLYDSFFVNSNFAEWTKLRESFTSSLDNISNTISVTLPAVPNYNIDKNQWVTLLIPGELISSNLTVPSIPFVIQAEQAEQLIIDTEYSSPVPGTGGSGGSAGSESTYGTTKFEMLNKDSIPGATKWQVKLYDYLMDYYFYYENIAYDSIVEGAIDYTQGKDIKALPNQDLLLLATDDAGKVKKYALIYLVPEMVSLPIPSVENLSFDNSDPATKNVVIQGNELSSYNAILEVITSDSGIPSDAEPAEYELSQLYPGTHPLTPLQNTTTVSGDTVYYRFVNGQIKSPWVSDGIVTYNVLKPINSKLTDNDISFILSGSEKKAKIKGIPGIFVAVIKNGYMLTPVSIAENGYTDISIDNISPNDPIFIAILNESGNISAKSAEVYLPDKMYNHIDFKKFAVLGHLENIYIKSNYAGCINLFKNGTLNTSHYNIIKNYDTYIPVASGLANDDKIQVQLIDEFGNESELSDEVMVIETPNINDIQLNFGTAEADDSITISNLEAYAYYKITIVNASTNEKYYELVLNPSDVTSTGPLTFSLGNINGTAGSTYKIYFSDFNGNTSPMSEIITAQ